MAAPAAVGLAQRRCEATCKYFMQQRHYRDLETAGIGDNGAALRRVLSVEDKHERPTFPERKAARSARAASRALDLRHWAAAEGWKPLS